MTFLTDLIETSPIPSGDVTTVRAETTSTHGRFIVSANAKHFVSDARASVGGPGEAVQAGELLLSALASCGLGLIQAHAKKKDLDLGRIGIATSFKRHADDPTRYDYIRLLVSFDSKAKASRSASSSTKMVLLPGLVVVMPRDFQRISMMSLSEMKILLPPVSAGALFEVCEDERRRDQPCQHRHAPVAAEVRRQEKWSWKVRRHRTSPSLRSPRRRFVAFRVGDAAQAAPSNPRPEPLRWSSE